MSSLSTLAVPLHVPGEIPPPLSIRLAVAMLTGLLATLGMTVVMRLQSYGYVPAYVAAGAVWQRPAEDVSWSAANAVHLAAGMLAGVGFEALLVGYERLRDALGIQTEVVIAEVTTASELTIVAIVVVFLYGFFSWLVFPRFGGAAYETRPETVRRQWALSAVVYGVGLFVAVTVIYRYLPV
jgi:hypothetical protein